MSDLPAETRRACRAADALEPAVAADEYRVTTTPFTNAVRVAVDGDATAFEVTVRTPTLSAATASDETVAPVVEDGWLETFERRVADADGVTRGDYDLDPAVARDGDEVTVTYGFATESHDSGVADAVALVRFVEGTYVQGTIPGYEYVAPVADLLAAARRAGER